MNHSIWDPEATPPPPLREDLSTDVCVVGAGIAGLSVAYQLARRGRDVVVLEDRFPGWGETGVTTAHLSSALDEGFDTLERFHGTRKAERAFESHRAAVSEIERIVRVESIDCDFRRVDGYLVRGAGDDPTVLEKALDEMRRAGFDPLDLLPGLEGFPHPVLRVPDQARFHPLKYLAGLGAAVVRDGGRIHGGARVVEVDEDGMQVRTRDGRRVRARHIVLATNTPIDGALAVHARQSPHRTYAVAAKLERPIPDGLYWDTADPYHYVRLHEGDDGWVIIVGGEDHATGSSPDHDPYGALEDWARGLFPLGAATRRWSGQVMEPVDGLAFIGPRPGNRGRVFIVTGDSGHGMTHGTLAGLILADGICDVENPWSDLYDPRRTPLKSVLPLLHLSGKTALHYTERVRPPDGGLDPGQLAPGEGGVGREGGQTVAMCRDATGRLHTLSAVCPHMGCVVHWNALLTSWDCPCHGSRFAPHGTLLRGPAVRGLDPVEP